MFVFSEAKLVFPPEWRGGRRRRRRREDITEKLWEGRGGEPEEFLHKNIFSRKPLYTHKMPTATFFLMTWMGVDYSQTALLLKLFSSYILVSKHKIMINHSDVDMYCTHSYSIPVIMYVCITIQVSFQKLCCYCYAFVFLTIKARKNGLNFDHKAVSFSGC